MDQVKDRILQLRKMLNEYSYQYYVLNQSSVSDAQFDSLFNELASLEAQHPEYADPLSITQRVGGVVQEGFTKVAHAKPMLSMGDVFSFEELKDWMDGVEKVTGPTAFSVENKIDGLAMSLLYRNGRFVQAVTRGDGVIGEDVTMNVKTIRSVPMEIDFQQDLEVRGEVYMPKDSFAKLNARQKEENKPLFANPRNAAAGSVRQLDPKIAAGRGLDAILYYVPDARQLGFKTHAESLAWIAKLGFRTNPRNRIMSDADEITAYIQEMTAQRNSLPFDIDGMRCDVNVSIKPKGSAHLGTKNEIKNLNSIANVGKAVDYEVGRQKQILESGGRVEQETRRFDEATKTTVLMRKKEGNVDYKFFPEPNIFPIRLDPEWIRQIQASMPELPEARKLRYEKEYGLSDHDINILIANKELSEFFERVMKSTKNAKSACNWLLSDVSAWLNKHETLIADCALKPEDLAKMIGMVDSGKISSAQAKELVDDIMQGRDPEQAAEAKGLKQVSDSGALSTMVNEVLDANPQAIEDFRNGKDRAVGFLVGQVMKKSRGQANPGMVNQLISAELKKRTAQ